MSEIPTFYESIKIKEIRIIRVICEICGMKVPRSRADGVSGYKNNVNYVPQPRWAGFPLRYNKLQGIRSYNNCLCLSEWVCLPCGMRSLFL